MSKCCVCRIFAHVSAGSQTTHSSRGGLCKYPCPHPRPASTKLQNAAVCVWETAYSTEAFVTPKQISLGLPTLVSIVSHQGSHWVCLVGCSTPSTPRKGRAAETRLEPLPLEFTLVDQAPVGQLATPGWVFPRGIILSTAAAAPHHILIAICRCHQNC